MRQRRVAGQRKRAQAPEVGAEQVELDDHRVVGVVQRDQLVALIREGGTALGEVGANLLLSVIHVAGRPDPPARRDRPIC